MNVIGAALVAAFSSFSLGLSVAKLLTKDDVYLGREASKLIIECEANLARNEFCELKAVPKQKNIEEK